uniref:Serine-rich coiled-coil domain-containing protein 2-like n=1 Tax=Neogobius melanostomus TaxID=47308 RepID=A0A8C6UIY3_9GOBI
MSAPPPVTMPTAVMTTAPVSRLPKFNTSSPSSLSTKQTLTPKNSNNATANAANANGEMGQVSTVSNGLSVSATASRLSNGFYQHSAAKTSANGRPNGFIRTPTSFSAKWRKENVEDATGDFEYKPGKCANAKKSPNTFTGKLNPSAVSSPKAVLKTVKATQRSTLNCLAKKQNVGGLSKSRSESPLEVEKQVAARSHSSDSIGATQNAQLTARDKARSRSLTQVQKQPSQQTNPAAKSSRAYSTNRAERKTPGGGTASMLPTTMMKKPLAPRQNGGGTFKIRAGVFKEAGPMRAQTEVKRNQRRNSVETPSSPGSSPEAPDSRGPSSERGSQNEVSMLGETLEDMSLSSTSSLDRHDNSQEYMDDFDNLGNGGVAMLLGSCCQNEDSDSGLDRSRFHDDERLLVNAVSAATELCFLDDGLDWNHIRLTADREHPLRRLSRRRRSSQPDYHSQCGSSLDLSPSDSCGSGGTFLWDEEVEPLGGAVHIPVQSTVRPEIRSPRSGLQNGFHQVQKKERSSSLNVGSLHSDVSSIDALNDLESCDLDEDDLMLDVDFPEDQSLTSDGGSHMAEWRRRQLCWTQDVHNDTDSESHTDRLSEEQQSKRKNSELSLDLCLDSLKSCPGLGADVEELVEDCSAVKSQLEYLQKLLLQDDDADEDTLTTDTLSPETDSSSDGTETQSDAAASSRCRCLNVESTEAQTQTRERDTETVASQTPWNNITPAILVPDPSVQDPLIDSGSVQSGSPSEAPPSPLAASTAVKDQAKRSPQPSKLRLFKFSGSSPLKSTASLSPASSKRSPALSPGSRARPGPAPSCPSPSLFSRLPKPKTH